MTPQEKRLEILLAPSKERYEEGLLKGLLTREKNKRNKRNKRNKKPRS